MRGIRSKFKRFIGQVISVTFVSVIVIYILAAWPSYIMYAIGIIAFILFCFQLARKFRLAAKTYINERGYVVLRAENDLEHRVIARNILNRKLKDNEVVHHINGRKTDNKIYNLCLMDSEKHELFHSWLSWKKQKSGHYPKFKDQKRILEQEYGGVLLDKVMSQKPRVEETTGKEADVPDELEHLQFHNLIDYDAESLQLLFEELRKERLRIAREEKVPAYKIFYDKTLRRMTHVLPDNDLLMLKTIGPSKYQKYGSAFLAVIQKFKASHKQSEFKKTIIS
jgi:superfamily II DNA helicase RecQ